MEKIIDDYLEHFGVLGQKWGIRRYQNKDGSLTEAGRKRLGLDEFDNNHNADTIIKKGTKATRVIDVGPEYFEELDYGGKKAAKKYVKDKLDRDDTYDVKYFSIDDVKNSGRSNGKEYYLSWFTDAGWAPEQAMVKYYTLKKDIKVASGKQVVDALIDEVGPQKITELLKEGLSIRSLTLEYTGGHSNNELFSKVNKRFVDMGYDAIEDINDLDTDMPIIALNSKSSFGKADKIQSGEDAIKEILKKREKEGG